MPSDQNILGIRDVEPSDDEEVVPENKTSGKRKREATPLTPEEEEAKRLKKEEAALKREEAKYKIICGVDIGTTYFGVAYATTRVTSKDVEVISDWGNGQNDIFEKAPMRIAYESENPSLDGDKYAYDVLPGMTSCQWTKLHLDPSKDRSGLDDPLLWQSIGCKLMHLPDGMTAEAVLSDMMKMVYQQTLRNIGEEMGKTALEKTSLRFVITLPAGWSQKARAATRQAARDAGFGDRQKDDIVLMDDQRPRCFTRLARARQHMKWALSSVQAKTSAVILDCGGGTLDACTYRIISVEPLRLEEACVGKGVKAGATSIDRSLHELMHRKFGSAFEEIGIAKIGAGSAFMEAFEVNKRGFQGNADRGKTYYLPLKMAKLNRDDPFIAASYDFEDDMVKLTGEEMESLFETVVQKTFHLLENQVKRTKKAKNAAVKTVVLCGGLGSSPYLRSRVEGYISEHLDNDVELVRPKRSWSAICRGAVISHLGKSPVTYRRARDHIGVSAHVEFDPDKHDPEDKYDCPHQGPRALKQMQWVITRGQKLSQSFRANIACIAVIPETDTRKRKYVGYQDLYICSRKNAPDRVDDKSVKRVAQVQMDLTKVVKAKRKLLGAESPSSMHFNVDLVAQLGGDKGILEVVAKDKWKKYGDITLEYDADPAYKAVLDEDD